MVLASGLYYDSTTVTLEIADGRVRYQDSAGVTSDWILLPTLEGEPLSWGFFSSNKGVQGRLGITNVEVLQVPEPATCAMLLTGLLTFRVISHRQRRRCD